MLAGTRPAWFTEPMGEELARLRPQLFGIAYRMLSSASEAEQVVQQIETDAKPGDEPTLVTATVRACIARLPVVASREGYIGPWPPEPVDTEADPTLGAKCNQALRFGDLLLLDQLTPTERAAYVLHEAFGYDDRATADALGVGLAEATELIRSATCFMSERQPVEAPFEQHRALLTAFVEAARTGDADRLAALLTDDIVSYTDSNGRRYSARRPVCGRPTVVGFITGFRRWFWADSTVSWAQANGRPVALVSSDGAVHTLIAASTDAGAISQLLWIRNPAKLGRVGGTAERSATAG